VRRQVTLDRPPHQGAQIIGLDGIEFAGERIGPQLVASGFALVLSRWQPMVELGLVGIDVDDDTGPARNGVEFLNVALRDREMDEVDINTALGGEAFKLLFERAAASRPERSKSPR